MSKDPFWWTKYATLNPESLSDYFSQEEATELIDKFKQEFPEAKKWRNSMIDPKKDAQDYAECVQKDEGGYSLYDIETAYREGAQRTLTVMAVAVSGRAVRGPNLSDDTYQLVKSIAKWVYANSAVDHTSLLTQNPKPGVDAEKLLDYISSATGISRKKISEWVWAGIGEVDNG